MSCSHLLILNRHVFLNTSDCRRAKYSCEWILCGTDIKLWTLLQYGEQADGAARRCNKPQSQRSISHQLVVRKAFLLTSHPEYQTVQSGRSQSRISFPGGVQKVLWQLWVSGPSSADTTGGHRDIKQLREKRRSITSDNCSQNFFFFSQHRMVCHEHAKQTSASFWGEHMKHTNKENVRMHLTRLSNSGFDENKGFSARIYRKEKANKTCA